MRAIEDDDEAWQLPGSKPSTSGDLENEPFAQFMQTVSPLADAAFLSHADPCRKSSEDTEVTNGLAVGVKRNAWAQGLLGDRHGSGDRGARRRDRLHRR
jgi:hypothetical protein